MSVARSGVTPREAALAARVLPAVRYGRRLPPSRTRASIAGSKRLLLPLNWLVRRTSRRRSLVAKAVTRPGLAWNATALATGCTLSAQTASLGEPPKSCADRRMQVFCRTVFGRRPHAVEQKVSRRCKRGTEVVDQIREAGGRHRKGVAVHRASDEAVVDGQCSRATGSACASGWSRCCLSWWRDLTPSLRNALRRW